MTIITCGLCGHTGDRFELLSCADEYRCPSCGEVIEADYESDDDEGDDYPAFDANQLFS
jgi:hypothetical protein